MKRILTLLAAAMMVLGTVGMASAASQLSASGQLHTALVFGDNVGNFDKNVKEDNFWAGSRVRTRFEFKANENLRGVWEVQVGNWEWGRGNAALNNGRGSVDDDFRTRLAYLSFNLPNTKIGVNMGIQLMETPSAALGNYLISNRVAGITVAAPLADGIDITALWARPLNSRDVYDANGHKTADRDESYNSFDVFGVIAGLDFGAAKVSPYFLYARAGHDSGSPFAWANSATADDYSHFYGGGAAVEVNVIEALSLKLDAMYATTKNDTSKGHESDGFTVAFAIDYAMPFGTPGLLGWYSSGADKDGEGYMPTLANDGGFAPTSFMTDGSLSLGNSGIATCSGIGTMGIGVQVADMSFIDNLSHTARVVYMAGTNDNKGVNRGVVGNDLIGINEEISIIEFNFDTKYQIMESLTSALELGYAIFDSGDLKMEEDNSFNANLYFMYNF